jgi:hypothetical protein
MFVLLVCMRIIRITYIMKHAACSLFVFCSFLFMLLMLLIRDSDCVASKLTDDLSTLTVISVSELPARRAC